MKYSIMFCHCSSRCFAKTIKKGRFYAEYFEELYHGNNRPDSRIYVKDSPFVKAAHVKKESMDKLKDTMNEVQRELFETYLDAEGDIDSITRYDIFTYSFILGSSLMMEILAGREEMLK